jgi:hypothetical protein
MDCNHWFSFSGKIPALKAPRKEVARYGAGRALDYWFAEYTLTEPFGQC